MKMMIWFITVVGAAMVFAAEPSPDSKVKPAVQIDNFSFTPQTLTVHTGTRVVWINRDDVPHTVTSVEKKFKSRVLDTDEQFSYTFSAPGTYDYYCSVHPHMTGKIVVR